MAVEALKILAIEQNPVDLVSLAAVVQEALPGAVLVTASTGEQGVTLARDENPDVILLDLVAAEVDGYATCLALKADTRLSHIPVVVLTERQAGVESRLRALKAGAEGFLSMPPDAVELLAQMQVMAKIKAANQMQRREREELEALAVERTAELERMLERERGNSQAIIDMAPVMIAYKNRDDHFVNVNAAFAEFVGLPKEKIIGMTTFDLVVQHDVAQQGWDHDREVMRTGIPVLNQLVKWSGFASQKEIWALYSKMPFYDADGGIAGTVSFVVDVDDRVRAEAALRESEERYRLLVETSPDGIGMASLDGQIVLANKHVATLFGYADPAEMVGANMFDLFAPEERARAIADFGSILQDGVALESEYVMVRRDGTRFHGATGGALLPDAEGAPLAIIGQIRDVSERKRVEAELHRTNRLLDTIIENIPNMIFLKEAEDLRFARINRAGEDLLGSPREELLGKNDYDLFPRDEAEFFIQKDRQVLRDGGVVDIPVETIQTRLNGRRLLHTKKVAILDSDGVPEYLLGISEDITARTWAADALQESHDMIVKLTAQVPGVVYQYRLYPDGRSCFPFASRGMNDIYEVTPEEVREDATLVFGRLHPDDYDRIVESIMESARTLEPFHCEFRVILPRQGLRWRLSDALPERTEDGGTLWYGIISDITERKLAEEALRESEARFRVIFEHANDAMHVNSADDEILQVNPRMCELMGYSREELVTMRVMDLRAPEVRTQSGRVNRSGLERAGHVAFESVNLHRSGRRIPVEVSVARMDSPQGALYVSIVRDITERKRAEAERERLLEQVQAQAQQIAQLMDTVPEGVLLLDAEGRVLLANPVAVRELATLAGVAVGERLTHLGGVSLAEMWAAAARGVSWREIHVGRQIFEVIVRPVSTHDGPAAGHWVVVVHDVTQTRDLRDQLEQQEKLAAVGQLAAGIAHDFNNILAIIALQAPIVARAPGLTERDHERLTTISEQAGHATRLIQQLLDFSRRAVLERRPLDLEPLLKEQVKLLARTLPETIQVTLTCEPGDYVVLADPTRLQQMLTNLAVNARDAMPAGGTLRLTLARQETAPRPDVLAGPWVRLELADDGTGMAPETQAHLFEPFFTTKPRGQGTGLGLAQVHGIVKQHDGEIEVHSTEGKGTTFIIYLPAVAQVAVAPSPAAEPQAGADQMILIVEDNAALLEAMTDIIELLGYRVVGAKNGAAALAVLAERGDAIALVLSDLVMPEMGGEALFRAMRASGLTTPVVMLSGHPLEGELVELKAQGLAGWLLKPPNLDDLARLLAQAMATSPQT